MNSTRPTGRISARFESAFYRSGHANRNNWRLHFTGTAVVLVTATFRHPCYSLAGDFIIFRDMLTGRIPY